MTHGIARRWSAREVSADLAAMVQEMGRADYVYRAGDNLAEVAVGWSPTCSYVGGCDGTGPGTGCIVGEWLRRQGVNMDDVSTWEVETLRHDDDVMPDHDTAAEWLFGENGPDTAMPVLSGTAVRYLSRVQSEQDQHTPWGQCLTRADNVFVIGR